MMKFTIYTPVFLILFLHIANATGVNNSTNESVTESKPLLVISIYESLYSAIEMDSTYEIKQFISFGADINHRYKGDKTPLMLTSHMGSIETIQALLELGANPNLVSAEDMTAMDYAKESGNDLIIAALNSSTPANNTDSELIQIKKIQFLLGRLGYDAGKVDGEYGKRTKQSLARFTKDTKQSYPAEVSTRQVNSLKNAFFQHDIKEANIHTKNIDSGPFNKNSEEELSIIKTIPLLIPIEDSIDAAYSTKY